MILAVAIIYFLIIIVGAGLLTRKKIKSANDFNDAGKSMGWGLVAFTFVLIPLGSGHSMSLWEQATGPLAASTLWWALGVGAIFMPIMMLWLGPLARRSGCITFPQITRNMYGRGMGWMHACITIGSMTGICAAEIIATGAAIYALSDGALPLYPWGILLSFVFVLLYVLLGGMLQMAWISVVNSIVMIGGSFLALIMIAVWVGANLTFGDAVGLDAVQAVYESQGALSKLSQFNLGNMGIWFGLIIPVIFLHLTAAGVSQPHNMPFFAARSEQDCRKGIFVASAINAMSAVPWVAIALIGVAIPAVVAAGGENLGKLIVPIVALQALPKPIVGILMVSLLSATLSTAGAIVLGNASLLEKDIIKGALFPNLSEKSELLVTRICILVCGLACLIPALKLPVIMPVFIWCFTFSMPIFVNYIMGMYVKVNKTAAWLNIIIGYSVAFIWTFTPPAGIPFPFNFTMYPVLTISIICGIILPLVLPGGSHAKFDDIKKMSEMNLALEASEEV
jgi:SSS family solute:Na+ symporter